MKRRLFEAVAIAAITGLLLVAIEVGLRIAYPDRVFHQDEVAYQFQPDYLITLKPSLEKVYHRLPINGADKIVWRTNADRFRGEELEADPDYRIIVYGDSNVQARFTELANTFPVRLEQLLNDQLPFHTEAINAGIVGFGPDQSLLRMESELERYQPDLVIFVITSDNDFGDLIRNRLFELGPGGELVRTDFEAELDPDLRDDSMRERAERLLMVRALRRISRRFSTPEPEAVAGSFGSAVDEQWRVYQGGGPSRFSVFSDSYDYDVAADPTSEQARTKVELMTRVLDRARLTAEAGGAAFLVVSTGSAVDLTENYHVSYRDLEGRQDYRRDNLRNAMAGICEGLSLDCVYLHDVFAERDPSTLFFRGEDSHWNDAGQRVAAEAAATYILQNIKPSPATDPNAPP